MAEYLNLDILTPDGRVDLHAGQADKSTSDKGPIEVEGVELPAALGELGVRPRHIPFLTPLVPGVVRFRFNDQDRRLAVGAGFVEISEAGVVTLLTERAVRSWEIDVDGIRLRRDEVVAEIKQHSNEPIGDATMLKLIAQRDWLEAQLRAAQA